MVFSVFDLFFKEKNFKNQYTFNTVEGAFQAAKLGSTNSYIKTKTLTADQQEILKKLQTATGAEANL